MCRDKSKGNVYLLQATTETHHTLSLPCRQEHLVNNHSESNTMTGSSTHEAHTDVNACLMTHTPSSLLFICSPSSFICGWPRSTMISQAFIKASSVHFCRRQSCKIAFCSLSPEVFVMFVKSPPSIMPSCLRSYTMALASTMSINWLRKWLRTCCAAWRRKSHAHQVVKQHAHCIGAPYTQFEQGHSPGLVAGVTVLLASATMYSLDRTHNHSVTADKGGE